MTFFMFDTLIIAGMILGWSTPAVKKLIVSWWRTLFPKTIREHEQIYCSICDGRIWFWQHGTRLYSLGMTRVHLDCGARYLREELEVRRRAVHNFWEELNGLREKDQRKH